MDLDLDLMIYYVIYGSRLHSGAHRLSCVMSGARLARSRVRGPPLGASERP